MNKSNKKLSFAERTVLYHAGYFTRKRKIQSFFVMVRPFKGHDEESFTDLMIALIEYGCEIKHAEKINIVTADALHWYTHYLPCLVKSIQNGHKADLLKEWSEVIRRAISSIYRQKGAHAFGYIEHITATGTIPAKSKKIIYRELEILRKFNTWDTAKITADFDCVFGKQKEKLGRGKDGN